MSNNRPATPSLSLPDERISATEQAGGILAVLALTGILGVVGWFASRLRAWLVLALASSAIAGVVFWVFRHPTRRAAMQGPVILAPSDGIVGRVSIVQEPRFLRGPAVCIALKVSMRNVQVTHAPLDGTVRLRRYEPGKPIHQPDDALWLGIKNPDGTRVAVRQTASPLWRRIPSTWARCILCWPDLEDELQAGQTIGHLTLGGTVEVFVPCTATIRVRAGQRVAGAETILASLPIA